MVQSGKDAFKKMGAQLKKDVEEKQVHEEKALAETKNQLDMIRTNKGLADMYRESGSVGAENLGGLSLPLLKVHAAGRSTSNMMINGEEPGDGYFFYKPTKEAFKEVECHILTISKGYRADGLQKKDVFHQILAGAIIDNGIPKPFITFFTGKKLSYLWDFGKEAGAYTKAKPFPIPLFALKVKLTSKREQVEYESNGRKNKTNIWLINFEIMKNEDGTPILITDPGLFALLKENVGKVQEMINNLIETKSTAETVEKPVDDFADIRPVEEPAKAPNPDDIPF